MSKGARHGLKIVLDGLHFLNSYWMFHHVNVEILNCHAASLVLELKHLKSAIIQNCTIGNWTLKKVQNAFIKNCNIVFFKGVVTALFFSNSSAFLDNVSIKHENISGELSGIIVYNNSLLHIQQAKFVNNTVKNGIIKTVESSTLIMSNCTVLENHATKHSGVIYAYEGFIHLKNTVFNGNMAINSGNSG